VVVQRGPKLEARNNPDLWAACIDGPLPQDELTELAEQAGPKAGRIADSFDCCRRTSAKQKLSKDSRPMGGNFHAQR